MNYEDLEIQYTPSHFSKRFPNRDLLLKHFINFAIEESKKCRDEFNCHLNVPYGNGDREKVDIYGDDLARDAPLFIFIHGGYWQEMDKNMNAFMTKSLTKRGVRSIIVGYDLCPVVTLEELVKEIETCFAWIAKYIAENNVKKIAVAGHSAGAHLLAFALSEDFLKKLPKEVSIDAFFISGIYYFEDLRYLKAANDKNILSITEQNYKQLSPQYKNFYYFKNFNIRAHIFVGTFESPVYISHSRKFAEGPMKDFVATFEILDCDHFDIVEKFVLNDYELTNIILHSLDVSLSAHLNGKH